MPDQAKKHQTQWAAQFYAAAELTRRGNVVTFTLGNTPKYDLLVVSPKGKPFKVEVKGLVEKNFWLVQRHALDKDLYYILVLVPSDPGTTLGFFVLNHEQLIAEMDKLGPTPSALKKGVTINNDGINWSQCEQYENCWKTLPA